MKAWLSGAAAMLALLASCGGDDGGSSDVTEAQVLVACNDSNDGGDAIQPADLVDDLEGSRLPGVADVAPSGSCVRVTFEKTATAEQRQEIEDTVGELPGIVEMRYED